MVVITHEMAVVEEICSHVAILDHGVLQESGSVEEVFSNPKTEAGRRLVYPAGVVTVSYTHLDVYKRQAMTGSRDSLELAYRYLLSR